MTVKKLSELTDQELLLEAKKAKSTNIFDALMIGLLIGIAIYSVYKHGLGLLTFIPLVYAPIAARNKKRSNELENLLKERNLTNNLK